MEQIEGVLLGARQDLDYVMNVLMALKDHKDVGSEKIGREIATAYTSLQAGRMWLGEVCFGITGNYPYSGTNEAKKPEDIAKAVDLSDTVVTEITKDTNIIEVLGSTRTTIDSILETVHSNYTGNGYYKTTVPKSMIEAQSTFQMNVNYINAYSKVKEARMWLGVAMGKIRDNHAKD